MPTQPRVSVIIPVFNAEPYLRQCLDGVVRQTLKNAEIICVDDGSTDGSPAILEAFKKRDPRITVLRQENRFAGTARNLGMTCAHGEYLAFWDADDLFEPNALEVLYTKAKEERLDMIKCSFTILDNDTGERSVSAFSSNTAVPEGMKNRVIRFSDDPERIIDMADVPWNGLYRRDFLLENGIHFNDLRCVNDRSFFVWALICADRLMVTEDRCMTYRTGVSSSLVSNRSKYFENQTQSYVILKEITEKLDPRERRIVLQRELGAIFGWFDRICREGQDPSAAKNALKAFVSAYDEDDVGQDFLRSFFYRNSYESFRLDR